MSKNNDKSLNGKINKIEKRLTEHENQFIERENRIISVVKNFIEHGIDSTDKDKRDASRKATMSYVIRLFLRTRAISIISITFSTIVGLVSLYFLCQSNQIIREQNSLMEAEQRPYFSFTRPIMDKKLAANRVVMNIHNYPLKLINLDIIFTIEKNDSLVYKDTISRENAVLYPKGTGSDYTFTVNGLSAFFYDDYPNHKIFRELKIKYEGTNGGRLYIANIKEEYQNNRWNIITSDSK